MRSCRSCVNTLGQVPRCALTARRSTPRCKRKASITIRTSGWGPRRRLTGRPGVHRVAALLKRWLLGTHHGAVDPRHVDYYLDEFAFRFNRRTSRSRGMLFYRLIQQAAVAGPVTYTDIRDNLAN